ncbi:MAG: metallopeptidase family protein [Bacteroidota bacterium]
MKTALTIEEFEKVAQEAFDALPKEIQTAVENLHIVIEDVPSHEVMERMHISHNSMLLGLYEGIPLTRRGTYYGTFPVVPDKITLYKRNIEIRSSTDSEVRMAIRDVLIHEIAHHYGMDEEQVRNAGY